MTAAVKHTIQRLLPLQLLIASIILAANVAEANRAGRELLQTRRHTFNVAWTVRGACDVSWLKNNTYNFEQALADASLADLRRQLPDGNVEFLDLANIAGGGTSCKDLTVVSDLANLGVHH